MRLVILAFIIVLFLPGCKKDKGDTVVKAKNNILVVLDPAHGGTDSGSVDIGRTMLEREQVLRMCNKIAQLSGEYNIAVILTRAEDKTRSYDDRLAVANPVNAAMFLSLHIRKYAADSVSNDFETIVSASSAKYAESKVFAASLTASLSQSILHPLYTEKDVYVLKNNVHPAVTIECGNIDNSAYRELLRDDTRFEALCRDLLEGMVTYANSQP